MIIKKKDWRTKFKLGKKLFWNGINYYFKGTIKEIKLDKLNKNILGVKYYNEEVEILIKTYNEFYVIKD